MGKPPAYSRNLSNIRGKLLFRATLRTKFCARFQLRTTFGAMGFDLNLRAALWTKFNIAFQWSIARRAGSTDALPPAFFGEHTAIFLCHL